MDQLNPFEIEAAGGAFAIDAPYEFANVVRPLLVEAASRLRAEIRTAADHGVVANRNRAALLDECLKRLHARIFDAVSRVLILELAAAQTTGHLLGDTPGERYAFFVECLGDAEFGRDILGQYPALEHQVALICENTVNAQIEFLRRLTQDWPKLKGEFFAGQDALLFEGMDTNGGDSHCGGRSVIIARLSGGARIVYKPRPLAVDMHFSQFSNWLNEGLGAEWVKVPATLDCGDYGWCEYISAQPVADDALLGTYYERLGVTLAALWLIGGSDFHSENLIAHGAWPVSIDLETLFHPHIATADEGATARASRLLGTSVLSTGVLPCLPDQRSAAADWVDLSGLADQDGALTPFAIPVWEFYGSDEMRLVNKRHVMSGNSNLPVRHSGERVSPQAYREAIVNGFAKAYRFFLDHKSKLLSDDGPVAAFADAAVRVVLRPTTYYGMLIEEGFHPDHLASMTDKAVFFGKLAEGLDRLPLLQRAIESESQDLWASDIPYFTVTPNTCRLINSQGTPTGAELDLPGLKAAQDRIAHLGRSDLDRQIWHIRASLASGAQPQATSRRRNGVGRTSTRRARADAAREIARIAADRLCALAIAENDRASWLVLKEVKSGTLTAVPAGLDLYSGLPGIALFLSSAARTFDIERYRVIAGAALRECVSLLACDKAHPLSNGGFAGRGGAAYAFGELACDFPDLELLHHAYELVLAADLQCTELDMIDGLSGLGVACRNLYCHAMRQRGADTAAANLHSRARDIGQRIISLVTPVLSEAVNQADAPVWRGLKGFAHGLAGIAYALDCLGTDTGDPIMVQIARQLRDMALKDRLDPAETSWCRGSNGIALATGAPSMKDILRSSLKNRDRQGNHSLCHGLMGDLCAARKIGALDRGSETEHLRRMLAEGLACGTLDQLETPGLMDGLAGIGLGSLWLADPAKTPFPLLLQPTAMRNT